MPPIGFFPGIIVSWTLFTWLLAGSHGWKRQALTGWAFGFGYLLFGLYWIAAALFTDIGKYWWLVPFAVTGLPAALALFWAAAGALAGKLAGEQDEGLSMAGYLSLVLAFALLEYLRGFVLTGFPWNLPGYAFLASLPVMQGASLIGAYGMTLLAIALAAAPALLGKKAMPLRQRAVPLAITCLLTISLFAWGVWRLESHPTQYRPNLTLRLVQPNIAQDRKWDASERRAILDRLLALSIQLSAEPGSPIPDMVIWPESAVPYALDSDEGARKAVALAVPVGGLLLTGAVTRETEADSGETRYYNSIVSLTREGEIGGSYAKIKLVPFGEFLPLRNLLHPLGLDAIAAGAADFSKGRDATPKLIPQALVEQFPQPLAMICYEAIFPGFSLTEAGEAGWIVNVTNDAWFGTTAGPYQHFSAARTRAIVPGLPLVRVANTGISGLIDPLGRVVASTRLETETFLDVSLPRGTGSAYQALHYVPDAVFWLLMAVIAATLALNRRKLAKPHNAA
jgi:apolipoprotein N-acyltransferase